EHEQTRTQTGHTSEHLSGWVDLPRTESVDLDGGHEELSGTPNFPTEAGPTTAQCLRLATKLVAFPDCRRAAWRHFEQGRQLGRGAPALRTSPTGHLAPLRQDPRDTPRAGPTTTEGNETSIGATQRPNRPEIAGPRSRTPVDCCSAMSWLLTACTS